MIIQIFSIKHIFIWMLAQFIKTPHLKNYIFIFGGDQNMIFYFIVFWLRIGLKLKCILITNKLLRFLFTIIFPTKLKNPWVNVCSICSLFGLDILLAIVKDGIFVPIQSWNSLKNFSLWLLIVVSVKPIILMLETELHLALPKVEILLSEFLPADWTVFSLFQPRS